MARFDVYAAPEGGYWLDCQSDLLADLNTRLVVPLFTRADVSQGDRRLNPLFVIKGMETVMQTHFASAVPARLLRERVTSLAEREYEIGMALDMLTGRW